MAAGSEAAPTVKHRGCPSARAAARCATAAASLLLVACAADSIEDRRFGQQIVCHDGRSIAVSNADSFVHLDHGDSAGPCPDG